MFLTCLIKITTVRHLRHEASESHYCLYLVPLNRRFLNEKIVYKAKADPLSNGQFVQMLWHPAASRHQHYGAWCRVIGSRTRYILHYWWIVWTATPKRSYFWYFSRIEFILINQKHKGKIKILEIAQSILIQSLAINRKWNPINFDRVFKNSM